MKGAALGIGCRLQALQRRVSMHGMARSHLRIAQPGAFSLFCVRGECKPVACTQVDLRRLQPFPGGGRGFFAQHVRKNLHAARNAGQQADAGGDRLHRRDRLGSDGDLWRRDQLTQLHHAQALQRAGRCRGIAVAGDGQGLQGDAQRVDRLQGVAPERSAAAMQTVSPGA